MVKIVGARITDLTSILRGEPKYGYKYCIMLNNLISHISYLQKKSFEFGGMLYCKLEDNFLFPFLLVYKEGEENTMRLVFYPEIPREVFEKVPDKVKDGLRRYVTIFFHTHPSDVPENYKLPTFDDIASSGDYECLHKIFMELGYRSFGLLATRLGITIFDDRKTHFIYKKIPAKKLMEQEAIIDGERWKITYSNSREGEVLEFQLPYQLDINIVCLSLMQSNS